MLIWSSPAGASLLAEHGILRAREFEMVNGLDDLMRRARDEAEALRRHAEDEAAGIVDAALQQAGQMIEQARAEAAEQVARARDEASRSAAAEWHVRHADLQVRQEAAHQGLEDRLAAIVAQAVERIVQAGPREALFTRALQGVRETLREARTASLRVHADDAEAARSALGEDEGLAAGGVRVQVEADPHCAPGTCVFESSLGRVDASLEVQLAGIRAALKRATERALAEAAEQQPEATPADDLPAPEDDGERGHG